MKQAAQYTMSTYGKYESKKKAKPFTILNYLTGRGSKVLIQTANIDDAEEILTLQKLAYKSEAKLHDDFQIPPLVESLDELKDKFNTHVFLKATTDGKIIGSVRILQKDNTCHIGRLMVHPDFQNRGIATKLLMEIEDMFPCSGFELFTGEKSVKNIRLYEKLGYKRFNVEKPAPNVNLVFLEKTR
jgi:ribosomal protein S18 acetylase RimI-like enzyme